MYQQKGSFSSLLSCEDSRESIIASTCACLVSPLYLSCDEGVKFLAHILSHDPCIKPGHAAIKSFLPSCTKSQAAKLAEAYCRAWRCLQSHERKKFEECCLQDLMYCSMTVHPVTASKLNGNLLAFLHTLHSHQKLVAFSTMLQKNYNPFLWRYINCANGLVRTNAITVLCDAYPLEDTSSLEDEREKYMTKMHNALTAALTDTCPSVRIAAIKGTCSILSSFWLVVPKDIIQSWFSLYLSKLALDASSHQVRLQVVKVSLVFLH